MSAAPSGATPPVTLLRLVPVKPFARRRTYRPELSAWATPTADQPDCKKGALVTAELIGGPIDGLCVAHALRSPHDGQRWNLHVPAGRPAPSDQEIKRLTKFLWRSTGAHTPKS